MALVFFLTALLGLLFPPFAIVALAMMIVGVFAKGMVADARADCQNQEENQTPPCRAAALRRNTPACHAQRQGKVIDVRCYPALPPLQLATPLPELTPNNPRDGAIARFSCPAPPGTLESTRDVQARRPRSQDCRPLRRWRTSR